MVTFTIFICLIQIQNTEICTANQPKITDMNLFLLILPSPTFKKCAFDNILLDAPSCGLREKPKAFFFLAEFMPLCNV